MADTGENDNPTGQAPVRDPGAGPFVWNGRPLAVLITCEHAGNRVPEELSPLFAGQDDLLASHRGYDAGAMELARALGREFSAPILATFVTRLVADCNRSPGRQGLFSTFTKSLPVSEKRRILDIHHSPHRRSVAEAVAANRERGLTTLHVGAHTFTPVLGDQVRRADVGLLYDPARLAERELCAAWRLALLARAPGLAVLRNSPYRGASDGLTTWLRRAHPESAYLGVELELNQKYLADSAGWTGLVRHVTLALRAVLHG
ncbi:N-formylglutamate amidohydrolase [Fundidesulfovibrio butyratiphilus]